MTLRKKTKKSQQETVGFILIIVMVLIAGVILLGLGMRKSAPIGQSSKISHFLESSLYYTTTCLAQYETVNYYNVGELIFACKDLKSCDDDKSTCLVLNQTLKELLTMFKTSESSSIKGYRFNISYVSVSNTNTSLISFTDNFINCTSKYGAQIPRTSTSGMSKTNFTIELTVCEGE